MSLAAAAALLAVVVAGCASPSAGPGFDRRWIGVATGVTCSESYAATLTRRGSKFSFVPNDGAIVITGSISRDRSIHGSLSLSGADHRDFTLTVDGTFTDDEFEGVYVTPRCESKVRLHPA